MKTITVTDALFARLLAMRDAYGDHDIAGMLDRITEVPASRLGPAYGTQCQRTRQAGPITVLGDDAGAEQRAFLAGHTAATRYYDSNGQVSDGKTGNPLTDLGAESHAYGQAMRAAGIVDTFLRDPKERAFLAGWRAGLAARRRQFDDYLKHGPIA